MAWPSYSNNTTTPLASAVYSARPTVSPLAADVWMTIMMLVSLVSSVLLVPLIYVILTVKRLRTGSGVYIAHLLCNHLFTCAIGQPIFMAELYVSFKGGNDFADCLSWLFVRRGVIQSDMVASMFLALNRFNAIYFPHHYKWWNNKYVVVLVILVSNLLGFGCNILLGLGLGGRYQNVSPWMTCSLKSANDAWTAVIWTVGGYLPMTVMGLVYGGIGIAVATQKALGRTKQIDKKTQMGIMLAASFLFYLVCYMPNTVMVMKYPFLMGNPAAFMSVTGLQLIGTCGNPVIFYAMSTDYRNCTWKLLDRIPRFKLVRVEDVTPLRGSQAKHSSSRGGTGSTGM